MGKLTLAFFGLLVSFIIATNVCAKDFGAVYQDAEITDAVISPSGSVAGTSAILRFNLTNTAIDQLTIMGVTGSRHQGSRIMAELAPDKFIELESLSLLSEEILNMEEAHIYIELKKIDLPKNSLQTIDLNLILATGKMPFKARLINNIR